MTIPTTRTAIIVAAATLGQAPQVAIATLERSMAMLSTHDPEPSDAQDIVAGLQAARDFLQGTIDYARNRVEMATTNAFPQEDQDRVAEDVLRHLRHLKPGRTILVSPDLYTHLRQDYHAEGGEDDRLILETALTGTQYVIGETP